MDKAVDAVFAAVPIQHGLRHRILGAAAAEAVWKDAAAALTDMDQFVAAAAPVVAARAPTLVSHLRSLRESVGRLVAVAKAMARQATEGGSGSGGGRSEGAGSGGGGSGGGGIA